MGNPPRYKDDITATQHVFRQTTGKYSRIGTYNKQTGIFYKEINEYYYSKNSICLDERVMMWLKHYDCKKVIVKYLPTGVLYTANLDIFFEHCELYDDDPKYGPQLGMNITHWQSSEDKQLDLFEVT
jgi:hypothetical protein